MIHPFLQKELPAIVNLFQRHEIKRAYAFGSVCTSHFNEKSDVDFLVSFKEGLDPADQGEHWWDLLYSLEDVLHREVDLLTESSLHNRFFIESVDKNKTLIYEA